MKFTSIRSTELPGIDISVKECVNAGQWFLFKANTSDAQVCFFLKVEKDIFALDQQGAPLTHFPLENIEMNEFIYFDDLPKPISLSNQFAVK
ncbi:TPA: hypothetical protein ACX4EX_001670 [Yersinia enterocolitica]|uniref:hypothetical protein n=1 Tax=Yersinia enterocolitica TaxID=630 RepID=UPI0005FCE150|nr:hypothetical protein [Yersinia enterocolitica]EKN5933404.1 hypothetical protein [Yersinia enterocolitica]MBX9484456.1 hypothetical protein [Yersinia enterocolitica]NQS96634.1 hypothetical protein [Yersinia enterocolitica]NQT45380.1 hypothetical protein [Yersinia enterocolitica]NQU02005.1 hypothetical protein [Yersinia enterocolitica]